MKKIYFLLSTALLAIPTFVAQAASTNGTVTDGWLMVEDFQNAKPGDAVTVHDIYNNPAEGSASVTTDPTDNDNLMAVFSGGNTTPSWKSPSHSLPEKQSQTTNLLLSICTDTAMTTTINRCI